MANAGLPETMKGLQLTEFKRPYRLSKDIPVPKIERDNEVLIKVAVAGYCHSDQLIQNGGVYDSAVGESFLPFIPSHECAGTIVAVGHKVTHLKVGDRVGVLPYKNPCGECEDCKENQISYCEHVQMCGVNTNGAAAEYMVADGHSTIPLPPNLSFDAAAPLMCAGGTIYGAIKKANLKRGQTLAIVGVGALGHLGIQFAKCMGLRVVAVDTRQAPLDLAKSMKYAPDYAIDATRGVEHAIKEMGGVGADATIVATDAEAAFIYGLGLTRKHGTFVAVGVPPAPIPLHYVHLLMRDLTVVGAILGGPLVIKEVVDFVAEKDIEVKTHVYALEDVDKLLEDFSKAEYSGKLILRVS